MKNKFETLKPCPFCGCIMGYLVLEGYYEWYGRHKAGCPIESNPSDAYGRSNLMAVEWNRRYIAAKPKRKRASNGK
jgi:hypothetical protein